MGSTGDGNAYYTIQEFKETLDKLTDADWARLWRLSANWCRNNRRPNDAEDVVQEAICRVFSGATERKRQWPHGLDFFVFMSGVMRSIASERPQVGIRPNQDVELDDTLSAASGMPGPESEISLRDMEAYLMQLFGGDEDAGLMLMSWSEGLKKSEIIAMNQWDPKKYEAVRKRIRRSLHKHSELKEMIQ